MGRYSSGGAIGGGITADEAVALTNKTINRSLNTLTNLNIVNADVDNAAAIAKSKLASLDIVNTDVNNSAAIALSKIAPISLDGLSDVAIVTPSLDQVLKYSGSSWINSAAVAVGAGPGIVFYLDGTDIIPAGSGPQTVDLETLSKTPTAGGEIVDEATVNNNTVMIDQYLYNTALGVTTLDAGDWIFDTYCYVDDATAVSEVIISLDKVFTPSYTGTVTGTGTSRTFTANAGTPFVAGDYNADITLTGHIITPNALLNVIGYTSTSVLTVECLSTYTNETGIAYSIDRPLFQVTTGNIDNTVTPELISPNTIQQTYTINVTDKLLARYFAKTTNTSNTVVSIVHNGTTHYSHFHTPLATKHNDLAGLQGGTSGQFYHATSAEYTGTGTGVFVRTAGPTISNVTISSGTITGTDVTATDLKSATTTVAIDAATAPSAGQVLTASSSTVAAWATPAGGSMSSDANRNTKGGTDALRDNVSGTDNSAIGYNALILDTASSNTAFGSKALDANTTGTQNTAVGNGALGASTTVNNCAAFGYSAGGANTGSSCTMMGAGAGANGTSGTNNTAVGADALRNFTTNSNCTAVGALAGNNNTGANNTFIGCAATGSAVARANAIGIGKDVSVTADSTWVIGTIGKKQAIVEGSNAAMGLSAAMTAGSIVISNTLVTANSRIFLTINVPGGTPGAVYVSARNAGTDFTITSTSGTDTSYVAWEIKEPN